MVLTFGFTVELLPPLAEIVQFGVEVNKNLDFLSSTIECVTHRCILACGVLSKRYFDVRCFLHILCTTYKRFDVTSCYCNRQQAYRCEYRETAAYVIGDNEGLVSLFGGKRTERTFGLVRNRYDTVTCFLFADLLLQHRLQQTESKRCLGRRTGLGDVDDTELFVCDKFHQLRQIVLANVITSIHHVRILTVFCYEGIKSRC